MRLIDADKRIARYCEENCGCTRAECISDEMPTIERCPHCGSKMMEKQND